MPGALDVGASDPASSPKPKAESIKLWLPSQLDAEDRDSICLGGIIDREKELRFTQLEDTLNDLRQARRIHYGLTLGARGGVLTQYITNTLQGNGQRT